jgi:hypothetical protein
VNLKDIRLTDKAEDQYLVKAMILELVGRCKVMSVSKEDEVETFFDDGRFDKTQKFTGNTSLKIDLRHPDINLSDIETDELLKEVTRRIPK